MPQPSREESKVDIHYSLFETFITILVYLGPGAKERAAMLKRVNSEWGPLMKGEEYNKELIMEFYIEMARDILKQRERIGGDWAVANVVYSREIRDKIRYIIVFFHDFMNPDCRRELLGDDLVFMNLSMGKEDKMKRLLARHGGDEQTASMFDVSFSFCFVKVFYLKLFLGL